MHQTYSSFPGFVGATIMIADLDLGSVPVANSFILNMIGAFLVKACLYLRSMPAT